MNMTASEKARAMVLPQPDSAHTGISPEWEKWRASIVGRIVEVAPNSKDVEGAPCDGPFYSVYITGPTAEGKMHPGPITLCAHDLSID